jgi:type I restriction enzyme S subunit
MIETTTHIKTEKRSAERSRSKLAPALRFKGQEDNWESLNLKQLIKDLQSGISVNSEDRPIADDSEFGILKTRSVADGVFKESENKKIVDEEITRAKLNPTENEIIISRMNTPQLVGESGYIDKTYPNLFVPDRLWQTITYAEKCHNRWLSYFLITDRVRYNLKSIATGTSGTMKNISKPNFLSIKVNCPSLPEQQKIASFLSAVDEKIQQLTKKKSLLEQYKKGVMQQLFPSTGSGQRSGQLRFKPARPAGGDENLSADRHDGNPYPEWKEKKISQVVTEVNERTIENNQFEVLSSTKSGIVLQSEYFNKQVASSDSSNYKIVRKGMFSYRSMSDTGSFTFNIQNVIEIGIVSPAYPVFKVNENQSAFYLYLTLNNSSHFKSQLLAMMEGGTRLALGFSKFKKMIVHLPSFEEQQKIATYLSSIDTKIEAVNTQITQTQTFKKGLLQQMFV